MDSKTVKNGLSVESVTMFAVSTLLFTCTVCLLVYVILTNCTIPIVDCARRTCCCYKGMITPHLSEVEQLPTPARSDDTEHYSTHEIEPQSTSLTSNHSMKLKAIIEHQEEESSSIA